MRGNHSGVLDESITLTLTSSYHILSRYNNNNSIATHLLPPSSPHRTVETSYIVPHIVLPLVALPQYGILYHSPTNNPIVPKPLKCLNAYSSSTIRERVFYKWLIFWNSLGRCAAKLIYFRVGVIEQTVNSEIATATATATRGTILLPKWL